MHRLERLHGAIASVGAYPKALPLALSQPFLALFMALLTAPFRQIFRELACSLLAGEKLEPAPERVLAKTMLATIFPYSGDRLLLCMGLFSIFLVGSHSDAARLRESCLKPHLDAARRCGVPVFNAPFSNTRSVAELVIGEIVMLLRRILPRSAAAHEGGWDKSAIGSREVRGRTLGIVGYGNIGSQLSMLAEAMGMKVIFFDRTDRLRHGNTEPVESLQDLLTLSDIVSLHVPETPATSGMIGETELRLMKPGSYLINNSRGTVVDLDALAKALRDGHLAGAALDVFPIELPTLDGSITRNAAR